MTTVFVHADYSAPVEQVRQEFHLLFQATEYGTKYDGIGVKVVDRCRGPRLTVAASLGRVCHDNEHVQPALLFFILTIFYLG